MKAEAFTRAYLSEFVRESPEERRAVELWAWYHAVCEAYDRRVCTGGFGRDGGAMPSCGWERSLINANATRVYREMADAAARDGVTSEEMVAGRRRVERMRLDEMTRIAVGPRGPAQLAPVPVGVSAFTRF